MCLCCATHEGDRTVCGCGCAWCGAAAGADHVAGLLLVVGMGHRMILRLSSTLHPHVERPAAPLTQVWGTAPQGRLTCREAQLGMCSLSASWSASMPSCCVSPCFPGGMGPWQGAWCRTAPACRVLLPYRGRSSPTSSSCVSVVLARLLLHGQGRCWSTSWVLPALQRISLGVAHSMGCHVNLAQLVSGATLAVTRRARQQQLQLMSRWTCPTGRVR